MENQSELSVSFLKHLPPKKIQRITKLFEERDYRKGDIIFNQGDPGDGLYYILEGSSSVKIDNKEIANLSEGQFFGEISLIDGGSRTASIEVTSDSLRAFFLSRQNFFLIKNDICPDIIQEAICRIAKNLRFEKDNS